jgi:hypothetical protein
VRRKLLDPAVDVRMNDLDAALFQHFLQVPITERTGQIPAHTEQDNVFFYAVSSEVDQGCLSGKSPMGWLGKSLGKPEQHQT